MSLIGQVVRIFYLFYMPSLILRTQIANTKIFKYFLENLKEKKKLNLICCWQMCMTWQSVFVTNHISNMAMYVYVAWYFLWKWSPYSLQLLLVLWYISFWNLSSFDPLPLYTYLVNFEILCDLTLKTCYITLNIGFCFSV